jgi:hypothetical protein
MSFIIRFVFSVVEKVGVLSLYSSHSPTSTNWPRLRNVCGRHYSLKPSFHWHRSWLKLLMNILMDIPIFLRCWFFKFRKKLLKLIMSLNNSIIVNLSL